VEGGAAVTPTDPGDAIIRDVVRIAGGWSPPDHYLVIERPGEVFTVSPLLGERARITRSTSSSWAFGVLDEAWEYDHPEAAAAALHTYLADPDAAEPEGWTRHIPSWRRREEGDPDREEVRR
jgi:hypothetical protein